MPSYSFTYNVHIRESVDGRLIFHIIPLNKYKTSEYCQTIATTILYTIAIRAITSLKKILYILQEILF